MTLNVKDQLSRSDIEKHERQMRSEHKPPLRLAWFLAEAEQKPYRTQSMDVIMYESTKEKRKTAISDVAGEFSACWCVFIFHVMTSSGFILGS